MSRSLRSCTSGLASERIGQGASIEERGCIGPASGGVQGEPSFGARGEGVSEIQSSAMMWVLWMRPSARSHSEWPRS